MSHNAQVLERIKANYSKNEHWGHIGLPSKQEYTISGNIVSIKIGKRDVIKNMQENTNAFEGWALVVKYWGRFEKVELCWEKPIDIDNGHYQRFLYRIKQFSKINHVWFSICNSSLILMEDLKIIPTETYTLNSSVSVRVSEAQLPEALLEMEFADVKNKLHTSLSSLTDASFINRQFPVGVFEKNNISIDGRIFTGGKSAIDLWGINKSKDLLIFELKAEDNNNVGIISELFFYVCVMQDVINSNFKHEKIDGTLSQIPKLKSIKAYFLAYDLHPMINDSSIFDELNKMSPPYVEYHYIQIESHGGLRLVF